MMKVCDLEIKVKWTQGKCIVDFSHSPSRLHIYPQKLQLVNQLKHN